MATIHYRNATLLVNGADLSGDVTDLSIAFSAEALDATAMGATTRVKKGGLFVGQITGKVLFDTANAVPEQVLFPLVEQDYTVLAIYPNGITAGSPNAGSGFGCRGVLSNFQMGGAVGTMLIISFTIDSQGLNN